MPLSRPCAALLGALLASSLCGRRGEAEAVATAAAGDDDVHRRHARLAPRTTYRGAPRRRKPGPQKKPPPKKKKKSPQKKKKKKTPQQKKKSPNRRPSKEKEDPFEVTITRPSRLTRRPAPRPTPKPTPAPTPWPTAKPTRMPTRMPTRRPVGGRGSGTASRPDGAGNKDKDKGKSHDKGKGKANPAAQRVLDRVSAEADYIDTQLFLYETPMRQWVPSTIYQTRGLVKGLEVMNTHGVAGMHYYLGDKGDGDRADAYGLTNLAAFLAQSMKETIKYDACSENSWDLVGGVYPLSNSCGQLGQSYQDYHCPRGEEHMECPVDKDMEITATTHAKWYGAPAPLFCRPKRNEDDFTGKWNHGFACNVGWVDPPKVCDVYEGQKAGGFDNSKPVANNAGRTDTEGCCWWGRGVIQTTGICNFGKLNYYLGSRAAKEGRDTPYADVDFCKDPEVICSTKKHTELKWIAGMFYWMESVQKYDERGWRYMDKLREFVDGGFTDFRFIDAVSGIVNRGCHDPPCGTGAVDGGPERKSNFQKALGAFKLLARAGDAAPAAGGGARPKDTVAAGGARAGSTGLACGADHQSAVENCKACAHSIDCPAGEYCWNGVSC